MRSCLCAVLYLVLPIIFLGWLRTLKCTIRGKCTIHSWTRGSSVASGTLRPFGPVSGSNVARGLSVLYLTRGDNVTPLYTLWDNCCTRFEYTRFKCGLRLPKALRACEWFECRTHSWTRSSSVASGSLRPFGPVSGSNTLGEKLYFVCEITHCV